MVRFAVRSMVCIVKERCPCYQIRKIGQSISVPARRSPDPATGRAPTKPAPRGLNRTDPFSSRMTAARRSNVESARDRDKHPWRTRPRKQRRFRGIARAVRGRC